MFQERIEEKQDIWRNRYHKPPKGIGPLMKQEITKWWIPVSLKTYERKPRDFNVLAIDSSYQMERLKNGGLFYVVRALGLNGKNEYRELEADFDYTEGSAHEVTNIVQRKMEYLEIKLATEALSNGFDGVILIDGSLYGRISHLMIESPLSNDREFFIRYYQEVMKLFKLARENNVLVIGISKESGSRFFRDFLIKQIITLPEVRGDVSEEEAKRLISTSLDRKREAFGYVKQLKLKYSNIGLLEDVLKELTIPRPDYQLIETSITEPGYTIPLLLGPSSRWLRGIKQIEGTPLSYLKSHFPVLSNNEDFVTYAKVVLNHLKELPAIVSFHILPDRRDSPLRIDVPAFCIGLSAKFQDVGWPKPIDEDIFEVLSIVATGYGGLDYHNIWLWKVDREVKFHRKEFDDMYLSKFKELVGVSLNARDYRRVRFV
ncbi:DNA double-strand break repair nuclease NurA [Palaeococcus sp. (in: euryarchaeotes)]